MSDYVLIDGDKAIFIPSLGASMVVVQPGTLKASGPATLNGTKLCIKGDENSVSEKALSYWTPSYPIAGTGTLEIKSLKDDQIAQKTQSGNKAVLLVGKTFDAKFVVNSPAKAPPPASTPDSTPQYSGTGKFSTKNTKFRGI